ncbi:MAG: extracellular solute-binding protein [Defluviitaleaceae bacterium]|nr:extracellular solute-binding protein [Defluviitaleaceae bacterium]
MNKKKFSLIALLLVVAIVLVACGNDDTVDETTDPGIVNGGDENGVPDTWLVPEPLTLSLMAPGMGHADWADMPFWRYLAEVTGISFTFDNPPAGEDFNTARNLALASGEIPDALFGAALTPSQQIEFGEAGTLIPLQDLIEDYAPNFSAFLADNPEVRASITAPDGNIYALPQINRSREALWIAGPLWYNGEHLDLLGFDAANGEVPLTLADFDELMFRMRDELPALLNVDSVFPISDGWEMVWFRNWFIGTFGIANRAIQVTDGTVVHNATTENYRAFLEHMRMYFEAGILHPEIFTLSNDANGALVGDGRVGLFQSWYPQFPLGQTDEEGINNPMFHPLTSEWSSEPMIPVTFRMSPGQLAISSTNPNPGATLAFFDFFYSEAGGHFAQMGPQGYFWDYATNEAGEEVVVFGPAVDLADGDARGRLVPFFGFPGPQILFDLPVMFAPDDIDEEVDMSFDTFIRRETENLEQHGVVPFPPSMLTAEEAASIAEVNADIESFITQWEAEFISGVRPLNDDTWQEFLNNLNNIGVERVVEINQTVYDRR